MTIDEGIPFFKELDAEIDDRSELMRGLLLGHLKLSEKTYDLSGGENIRIRLMHALTSQAHILGIDEPFKGLNNTEIYRVACMLRGMAERGKTVIVVDHEEDCFRYFTKHIVLQNRNGMLVEL